MEQIRAIETRLDAERKFPISFERMLFLWREFGEDLSAGFEVDTQYLTDAEYDNDLSVRDLLQEILDNVSPETGARVEQLVSPLDDIYRGATIESGGSESAASRARGSWRSWWWKRDPKIQSLRPWAWADGEAMPPPRGPRVTPQTEVRFDETRLKRRVAAAIRLAGPDVEPDGITATLGVKPTEANRQAGKRSARAGNGSHHPNGWGTWMLDSRSEAASENLGEHLLWLLDRMQPSSAEFRQIAERPEVEAEALVIWIATVDFGGPRIEPGILARLAAMGLAFEADVHLEDRNVDPWRSLQELGQQRPLGTEVSALQGSEPELYLSAAIRIMGSDLDPDVVTRDLGITPVWTHRQGDIRRKAQSRDFHDPYPTDMWILDLRREVESPDIGKHIDPLLDRLERSRDAFLSIVSRPGVEADIVARWSSGLHRGGPKIAADTLERLGALGIALNVEVYGSADE
ncbi:MAG: DUF4279 domain-containing protein [Chloroflexota bacterium]